jgi:AraC-like DNA-binding protein
MIGYYAFIDLCRAREYLREHFQERVSLRDAAREACMSPFHFHRMYCRAFGETPHDFVTKLRLTHAKKLLCRADLNVSDVCLEAGYESLGSFSSLFTRVEGCSPSGFRKIYAMPGLAVLRSVPRCMMGFGLPPKNEIAISEKQNILTTH